MTPTATASPDSGRANNFDFLRLVLAVLVIFSHSYPLTWGTNEREPFSRLTGDQVTGGELAVAGFFILSGFLITKSWLQAKGPADYFRRRVLRIYPGYLVAVAFGTLVVGPLASADPPAYWRSLAPGRAILATLNLSVPDTAPVFAANPIHAVNGSLWSIRFEFFCYLGVAALGLAGALRRRWLVLLTFLGWMAVYALQVQEGLRMRGSSLSWLYCYPEFWPRLAACFLSGALCYLYRDRIAYRRHWFAAALVGLIALAALPRWKGLPLAIPILGSYAFFYLGFLPVRRLQGFARRRDLSYGMYLYAYPVQQLVVQASRASLHPVALFLIAASLTTVLAFLSWTFVEKPFLKLKSR
jgi:peptidoglycan/LPS O-acetylase OafA/YrhL